MAVPVVEYLRQKSGGRRCRLPPPTCEEGEIRPCFCSDFGFYKRLIRFCCEYKWNLATVGGGGSCRYVY